jgi:hypothetical protein
MGTPLPVSFGPGSSRGRHGFDGSLAVINAYAEAIEKGKAEYAMHPAPGLRAWTKLDTGPWRGWAVIQDNLYVVSGHVLYRVSPLGDIGEIGGVPGDEKVQFAFNALADPHICLVAAGKAYVLHSGEFGPIPGDALPPVIGVCFIRGRFVFAVADGRFYYSDINSVNVGGQAFYNAEGLPDGLVGVWSRRNELILPGVKSIEVWSPTENGDDPFAPLGGGALPIGVLSYATIAESTDALYFVDNQSNVRRAASMQPEDVTPAWVSRLISKEPDQASITGHCYNIGNTNWYELSGSTFTIRFNGSHWTERETVGLKRWRGQGAIDFAGKTLIGDHASGQIWELDEDHPLDGDEPVVMKLQSAIIHAHPFPLAIYSLHVDIIPAVGLNDANPDTAAPVAMLRLSYDGGKSFGGPITRQLGRIGQLRRVVWRRLGLVERQGVVMEISISSQVAKCVMSCMINGQQGST